MKYGEKYSKENTIYETNLLPSDIFVRIYVFTTVIMCLCVSCVTGYQSIKVNADCYEFRYKPKYKILIKDVSINKTRAYNLIHIKLVKGTENTSM